MELGVVLATTELYASLIGGKTAVSAAIHFLHLGLHRTQNKEDPCTKSLLEPHIIATSYTCSSVLVQPA